MAAMDALTAFEAKVVLLGAQCTRTYIGWRTLAVADG